MTERATIERVLSDLYAARCGGDLSRLCAIFDGNARFRIGGTSGGKPISMTAQGLVEIRPWLALLIKSFRVMDRSVLTSLVDGNRAAVHWQANILSRITGAVVSTELIDLVEVRQGLIMSYVEVFLPL